MKTLYEAEVAANGYGSAGERASALFLVYEKRFGKKETRWFSAPGRTELSGNHTDHQGGRVLAGAVALDALAVAAPNNEGVIRIVSPGFPDDHIDLMQLEPIAAEQGKSASVVRGIAAWFKNNGLRIGGFDAVVESAVPVGSGLSSSAAYEVLIGAILNSLYNEGDVSNERLAIAGMFAENAYFGKPSGLMDQMTSAVGGVAAMDFYDADRPKICSVPLNLEAEGYALCITMTGGSHADLTDDYADIPAEMGVVATRLGAELLSRVDPETFYKALPDLRKQGISDRAILRALHFFEENRRVPQQVEALKCGNFKSYLELVRESGASSYQYLQNVFSPRSPHEQGIALALALSDKVLGGEGASRVHGGGFAGTIQTYVPTYKLESYRAVMNATFGDGSCHALAMRTVGACEIAL